MIFAHDTTQYLDFKRLASLSHEFPDSQSYVALQKVITIFRNPNEVVLNLIFCMTPLTIFHTDGLYNNC